MQIQTILAVAFAALVAASPVEERKTPTLAECCCCNGTPALGCPANQNCTPIRPGTCSFTNCGSNIRPRITKRLYNDSNDEAAPDLQRFSLLPKHLDSNLICGLRNTHPAFNLKMSQTALIINKPGEPLVSITRPIPVPGSQEVLVQNHAVGLNPHDRKIRDLGAIVPIEFFPYITGNDVAGVVHAVGDEVTNVKVGDRVFTQAASSSHDTSGLQEYTLTSATLLGKIPDTLSFEEAATLPVCVPSVVTAMFHSSGLGLPLFDNVIEFDYPSKTILILGGGSNCGKAAIQLARLVGFGTIAAVASKTPEKEAKLKQLGATIVIDRHSPSLQDEIRSKVGDDLIFAVETVSQGEHAHTLGVGALSKHTRGTLVTITHGTVDESAIGEKRAGYDKRFTVGSSHKYPDFSQKVWSHLPNWIELGHIVPFSFRTIKGLNAAAVNVAIDEYRGKGEVPKFIVQPLKLSI
ncbi:hypothetical protein PWT90_10176 [Aphanocladium album]|nr:hypothetical protein PWT90_10176 [Aphanocladium album]